MAIIRFRLYARTLRLISALTFSKVRSLRWVAHPRLDGSEWMFRGVASGAHGGRTVYPFLDRVEDGFVLPTLDAPLLCRRALRLQRTAGAFRRQVQASREFYSAKLSQELKGPD
jgi:hypothetical protein